jgi:hypothetical protein
MEFLTTERLSAVMRPVMAAILLGHWLLRWVGTKVPALLSHRTGEACKRQGTEARPPHPHCEPGKPRFDESVAHVDSLAFLPPATAMGRNNCWRENMKVS